MATFGVGLVGRFSPAGLREIVEACESLGYREAWYADEKFYRDVYVGLTQIALHSERLLLGPFLTDPYSRHPALTAVAVASLDEVSGGRTILGLGAGGSGFAEMGVERRRPAVALRECVEILRRLWSGEKVTYRGEVLGLSACSLFFSPGRQIPIYIGARGPRNLAAAGEVADGVFLSGLSVPKGVSPAVERMREGARKSGRTLEDLHVYLEADVCVAEDPRAARETVKPMVALALWNSFPDFRFLEPTGVAVPEDLRALLARRDYGLIPEASRRVPDALVDVLAVAGAPGEVAARFADLERELGIRRFLVNLVPAPGASMVGTLEGFARAVMGRAGGEKPPR